MSQNLPRQLLGLGDLADNLWWSWHPAARMLFKRLNRQAWKESGHNPVRLLNEIPPETLEAAAKDADYREHYDGVMARFMKDLDPREGWYLEETLDPNHYPCAFFSAEYGLHHSLPFYAGGLGFLAGDFIKELSDLKFPLVAMGFMYPEGYVRQKIRDDGMQDSIDETLDRDETSISRVLGPDGKQLTVKVLLCEPPIYVAVWKLQVGRVPLYLMDTDIDENDPWNRKITQHLYIGDPELRLRQEIVLGIGGCQVLAALGINHSILHLNEGHPAFALLERVREIVAAGQSFAEAADRVRETSVFTTHTPVPAGHDVFPYEMVEKYFHDYWPLLSLGREEFFKLGLNPADPRAGFNMTALALGLSGQRNGVSRRHGEVTRRMWRVLWPDQPEDKVPITHITNGVHIPTWINPRMGLLLDSRLGAGWLENHDDPEVWKRVDDIPDEELWKTHYWLKIKLIDFIRERARLRWAQDRMNPSLALAEGLFLDPSILTVGFARRFATYKRADLVFFDLEALKRLLGDRWRPIQIIFAGKAHPADDPGKRMLQRVFGFAGRPELAGRIAFVEDYSERLAQYMVHGVDVWLNNPLPPLEASGTSGMKAAVNGVPQLSILDGWWIEASNGENGWAFGGEDIPGDRDGPDARAIYEILEKKVIPLYYDVADDGVPHGWVKVMKAAMKTAGPGFSARRMAKEYITRFYASALKKA